MDNILNIFKEVERIPKNYIFDFEDKYDYLISLWYNFKETIQNSTGLFIYAMDYVKNLVIEVIKKSGEVASPNIHKYVYKDRGLKNIDAMSDILNNYKQNKGDIKFYKKYFKYNIQFKNNILNRDFKEVFSSFTDIKTLMEFEDILHREDRDIEKIDTSNLSAAEKIMLSVVLEEERKYENSFLRL
jgi:hypothetical protein